jgi:ADP-heptose:LPS heptosyltransferase
MDEPERILVIRLKSIGDVVLTLPAVNLIRDNFPRARITFLTSQENARLPEGFGPVDEVIGVDRAVYRRWNPAAIVGHSIRLLRQIRHNRFSITVDFQGYGETALLTWLSGAPRRWGNVYRGLRRWAYSRRAPRDRNVHPAEWNRSLLVKCGLQATSVRNHFDLPEHDLESARAAFAARGCDPDRPTLYVQPFTSSAHKDWPLEKYLAVARFWQARGVQILFGGGPADAPSLEPARTAGFVVVAGVPLMTAAGLMKLSSVVIGGDTGFLHLAVALGKRVVMLLNSGGPGSASPFGHADWAVAPPGGLPLARIETEAILQATASALSQGDLCRNAVGK